MPEVRLKVQFASRVGLTHVTQGMLSSEPCSLIQLYATRAGCPLPHICSVIMPHSKAQLPFDVKEVYGDHPVRPEHIKLDPESDKEPDNGKGTSCRIFFVRKLTYCPREACARLLTDFLFVKNGELVFPYYESCTKEFWAGVEVWGYMMAPTGMYWWLAWSLLWHLDWPGKHMELVRITNANGMSKEFSPHFRNE